MSPSAKKWAGVALRVAVTAVFLVFILRLIQFQDVWLVQRTKDGPVERRTDVIGEERRDGFVVLTYAKGEPERLPAAQVVRSEGFLTLLDRTDKALFFAISLAFLGPYTVLAFRWWLLLRGHGFQASFGRIFLVNYAGIFFNYFLPGGVGGDVTKAVLASAGEQRKAAVVGTVLLDRIIGLAVLVLLGAACLTPFVSRFADPKVPALVYGMLGAMVLGYAVYFSPWLRRRLEGRMREGGVLHQLDGVFRAAKERKRLVLAVAGLSACSQIVSIGLIFGLAWAMGVRSVPLWQFFVFEPVIFIVTALPISLGGWGVQEWITMKLFAEIGGLDANQAIALSLLVKISQILVSIPGGLLFALGTSRRKQV